MIEPPSGSLRTSPAAEDAEYGFALTHVGYAVLSLVDMNSRCGPRPPIWMEPRFVSFCIRFQLSKRTRFGKPSFGDFFRQRLEIENGGVGGKQPSGIDKLNESALANCTKIFLLPNTLYFHQPPTRIQPDVGSYRHKFLRSPCVLTSTFRFLLSRWQSLSNYC